MKLHPNAVFYFMFRTIVLWLFFSFFLALLFNTFIPLMASFFILLIVFSLINYAYCRLLAQSYRIELSEEGVLLDSGILNKKHETLIYNKIQSILINRSVIERILGLSTMVIQNAMGNPETIPGLGEAAAESFKKEILLRIK